MDTEDFSSPEPSPTNKPDELELQSSGSGSMKKHGDSIKSPREPKIS